MLEALAQLDLQEGPPLDLNAADSWPELAPPDWFEIPEGPPLDLLEGLTPLDLNADSWPELDTTENRAEKPTGRPETAGAGKPSTQSQKGLESAGKCQ